MEPDDRIALEIIASRVSERIQFIGTTVKNSYRKAALVRNQLAETQLAAIPIVVGTGDSLMTIQISPLPEPPANTRKKEKERIGFAPDIKVSAGDDAYEVTKKILNGH